VALSDTQCADYNVVKSEVLKAYGHIPEAYCQRLRNYHKQPDQTYREMMDAFEQWLRSEKVIQFSQ